MFRGDWLKMMIGGHKQVTKEDDECGFTKVKKPIIHNLEPWMNLEFVGQVFYLQDPEDPT